MTAAGVGALGSGCTRDTAASDFSKRGEPNSTADKTLLPQLPPSSPNPDDRFGVDSTITIDTIDEYLCRDDVAYRDMRLLIDPADFSAIGGDSNLPDVLEGFKITPLPYLASLSELPVEGKYDGPCLLDVKRDDNAAIIEVKENYLESMMVIEDLFPKDKPIFLTCGGSGYAAEMKALLLYLGWDAEKLYVIGPMWGYKGNKVIELIKYPTQPSERNIYMFWRADYALIDFDVLQKLD